MQSTPFVGRDNEIVGVLSVYFREPHVFAERDQQLGVVLGQQAAGLILGRAQQESLRTLNEALRLRTAELEASHERLARQAEDLLQQDRHREEFLAALGHELRNPMAAMLSSLAIISVSDDRSQRALAVLRRQTAHMTRLINDLLDITRVKHGKLRLERTASAINPLVVAALEVVSPQAERKGLALQHELPADPVAVDADPERLAQILDNLLRNAITYTDVGTISVSVRREGAAARVAVRDTGIGLDSDDLAMLFQPYEQRGARPRGDGLGLGLALVKALVEAHGGTIACASDGPGAGSEFSFTIPLAAAPGMEAAPILVAPVARHRILVVDDQRDVADALTSVLESLGQDVWTAYSGAEALVLAAAHRPEVCADVSMPGMTGAELARRLRQEFRAGVMTLVAITGHNSSHPTVPDGDFDRHMLKPVTVDSVAALLGSLAREQDS